MPTCPLYKAWTHLDHAKKKKNPTETVLEKNSNAGKINLIGMLKETYTNGIIHDNYRTGSTTIYAK